MKSGGILLLCQNTTMQVYGAWIENIAFYIQKHIAPRAACHDFPLVIDKPLGAPTFVTIIDVVSAIEFYIGCHTGLT